MHIRVECYAGYRGEQPPRRFWIRAKKVEAKDDLDRWIAPDHRYFKIIGDDNAIYIIRYDTASCDWHLTFYSYSNSLFCDNLQEGICFVTNRMQN